MDTFYKCKTAHESDIYEKYPCAKQVLNLPDLFTCIEKYENEILFYRTEV